MKIWLDDVREPPHSDFAWCWCRTVNAAKRLVDAQVVDFISFDHDLGTNLFTGYTLATYIEKLAYEHKIKPIGYAIHSANPVGRERIEMAMKKAEEYWKGL